MPLTHRTPIVGTSQPIDLTHPPQPRFRTAGHHRTRGHRQKSALLERHPAEATRCRFDMNTCGASAPRIGSEAAPAGDVTIGLVAGLAESVAVRADAIDVVFAHAVLEHLGAPQAVLAEVRRVLRSDGLLALSSSDWSAALVGLGTAAVERALRAHGRLRNELVRIRSPGTSWPNGFATPGSR